MDLRTFGQKLKSLRQAAGLSLAALAADSGVAKTTVHELELGHGNPTVKTLEAIAQRLGTKISIELGRTALKPSLALQEVWAHWNHATPEVKIALLYILNPRQTDYLSLLTDEQRLSVLSAARALGRNAPKDTA